MALEKVLDFFYPKFCYLCKKEKTYICPDCFSKIKIQESPFCPYCGKRSFNGEICKIHKISLNGFVAATFYEDELVKKIIDDFKYNFVKELSKPLAFLVFKFLKENPEIEFFKNPYDFILVPVPLNKRRLRWRGFNQSEEIAKELSCLLKIPLKSDILIRKKYTKPQMLLDKEKRKENIKNAFEVNEKEGEIFKKKKIILLDDVATTLSTLEEASKLLKQKGVKEVWGLVIAHGK